MYSCHQKNYKTHKETGKYRPLPGKKKKKKKNLAETIPKEAQASHLLNTNFKPTILNVLSELRKSRPKN